MHLYINLHLGKSEQPYLFVNSFMAQEHKSKPTKHSFTTQTLFLSNQENSLLKPQNTIHSKLNVFHQAVLNRTMNKRTAPTYL